MLASVVMVCVLVLRVEMGSDVKASCVKASDV